MKKTLALIAGLGIAIGVSSIAMAQEITLRLHHMLSSKAPIPAMALKPWAEKVEKDSGGRIKIQSFPKMQLGGRPPELYDQVKDGVVDLIWNVIGYTPGRFPRTEAMELPFLVTTGEATSKAFHEFVLKHAMEEFKDVKVIAFHTHGPGVIHTKTPVRKLEDLKGMAIRGGSRMTFEMLERLDATALGMPVPTVPVALSKGVLDGASVPWEVTVPLKLPQLVKNHTTFSGKYGFYTLTFVFAMNKTVYENLPADLKKVINKNSGLKVAAAFGRVMDKGDAVGRAKAEQLGNNIITLDETETWRWKAAATPIIEQWIAEMNQKHIDGRALVEDARALVQKYSR